MHRSNFHHLAARLGLKTPTQTQTLDVERKRGR
jgi:hypothetical protein